MDKSERLFCLAAHLAHIEAIGEGENVERIVDVLPDVFPNAWRRENGEIERFSTGGLDLEDQLSMFFGLNRDALQPIFFDNEVTLDEIVGSIRVYL